MRVTADCLGIQLHGVHGFRGTAGAEFLEVKIGLLGASEHEARRVLAKWLGQNPQRTEVMYAYVSARQREKR